MKTILSLICCLTLFHNLYSIDSINNILSFSANAEVIYYNSKNNIDIKQYNRASSIKEQSLSEGKKVYTVVIADILDANDSNEYIELVQDNGTQKIIIYNSTEKIFEYTPVNPSLTTKSYIEIEMFNDNGVDSKILKYYLINDSEKRKHISLYMIRIQNDVIEYVGEIVYYDEIMGSNNISVISHIDNMFVDINDDGEHELILAHKQKIGNGKNVVVEYQLFAYDKEKKTYSYNIEDWQEYKYIIAQYFD